ncbi:MAG: conjugative transfer signal peptidase TraF [Rhodospirillales bacterium]|nr:conjugative transfer signal peptidase TraF [Rhodospirillales bacterium]
MAVCAIGAWLAGTLLTARLAGLRVNETASMPRGLWRVIAADTPLRRGEIVAVCPPETATIREAVVRGYLPAGACPGGTEPLLKPVAAIAGDVVTVMQTGVAVDGRPVENTAPLVRDSAGRMLTPMPAGVYPVARGEVWLLSGHDPRSFDSRYFGPLPVANVQGVARPIWVRG